MAPAELTPLQARLLDIARTNEFLIVQLPPPPIAKPHPGDRRAWDEIHEAERAYRQPVDDLWLLHRLVEFVDADDKKRQLRFRLAVKPEQIEDNERKAA